MSSSNMCCVISLELLSTNSYFGTGGQDDLSGQLWKTSIKSSSLFSKDHSVDIDLGNMDIVEANFILILRNRQLIILA